MDSPIVRTRGKADVSYECETTDRVLMPSERPNSLVLLPQLDCFVRRAFNVGISGVKGGQGLKVC